MSQQATLDRFGWKHWEIHKGVLYNNQLSYRYHWTPANLLTPLFNAAASDTPWSNTADNLSSIEDARKTKQQLKVDSSRAESALESDLTPQTPR